MNDYCIGVLLSSLANQFKYYNAACQQEVLVDLRSNLLCYHVIDVQNLHN